MNSEKLKGSLLLLILLASFCSAGGQGSVPPGIHYQAVARDNYGKELVNDKIDVRFSVISGSPAGITEYMEVHSNVVTSRFGVFSLVIGKGISSGGTVSDFSQIEWSKALHFLKVEVKFENDFVDMGTMQFLAVPYALYAQRSLEPGPPGPKGDPGPQGAPGDPASDNQTLSFDGSNLSISGGNKLSMSDLLQNLTVSYQPDGTYLGISRGNSVKLANIESDGDPKNEIQDVTITSDKLKITNNPEAREWDLSRYLDNTDGQSLSWDPASRKLGISGSTSVADLSELKDDADANPSNEMQDLTWNASDRLLGISGRTGKIDLTELKNDADADPGNEIQSLVRLQSKPRIGLENDTVTVSINDADANPANELQDLTWNPADRVLGISGRASTINLSELKNDADADPANELQTISFDQETSELSISQGGSVSLKELIAFKAGITSNMAFPNNTPVDLIFGESFYNDGNRYVNTTGIFQAPYDGIYTFRVLISLPSTGSIVLKIIHSGNTEYENMIDPTSGNGRFNGNVTLKLNKGDSVSIVAKQISGFDFSPFPFSGYFSGFRVY
jgi:hypothetical protein